tara:strand:- start:31 stop:219 length:189 start_codon:yes stop_codon:yes gene_type:complete
MDMLTIFGLKKQNEEETEAVDAKVNIHTLYKHRWVWYHLILCIQMILTNILLIGILIVLAIK